MKTFGSVSAVVAAIDDEVAVELERLEGETVATLARIQQIPNARPHEGPDRERRLAIARSRAREQSAREDYLDRRAELEARETWLRKVVAAGRARLGSRAAERLIPSLSALADEALATIPAVDCVLLVRAADRPHLTDEWIRERATHCAKRTVMLEDASIDGGCIAMSRDGRVRFDNTFGARAERFESTWRHVLAKVFEEAVR